jgi:predicted RNase H-like HicB family nuclease
LFAETLSENGGWQRTRRMSTLSENDQGEYPVRQVALYPGEDGYWLAECPGLPGCVSHGRSKEKAITNIREAIEGYIQILQEDHLPVPAERFKTILVAI